MPQIRWLSVFDRQTPPPAMLFARSFKFLFGPVFLGGEPHSKIKRTPATIPIFEPLISYMCVSCISFWV